ncbi:MAG: recombinase family protein, partial [Gammaproteobacteria bacterium]|nr:recombinase family protein [Gammaproteobacteria bacterium]
MFLHQFDPKQGQIRDKFASFWKDLKGIVGGEAFPLFLLIIGTILPLPSSNGEPGGKPLSGTKGQLEDQLKKTILDVQELHQDYMSKLGEKTDCLGAIYARFSTKHQDSISDQVRKCLEFALKDGIYVPLENIHYDLATKGMKMNRPGLGKIRELL